MDETDVDRYPGGCMSEQRDYDKYLKGEIRVDGWKSDWRKDLESHIGAPPVIERKAPLSPQQVEAHRAAVRKSLEKRRADSKAKGLCHDCGKTPAREGRTLCQGCKQMRSTIDRNRRKKAA
jgi:hypothetical protein